MSVPLSLEEKIFHEAIQLTDPVERRRFLDEACASHAEARASVDDLLAAYAAAGSFFDNQESALSWYAKDSAAAAASPQGNMPREEQPGALLGHYKLVNKIGEGGCGVVYLAVQQAPVRRQVALKVIKLGMDTKGVIARFATERQALAAMEHPNIARVLDAGATATGRPYFVMDLVRGTKITEFCDGQRLDTRQRLDLFLLICQAIQHAHQKGIIHRDIKPSNILVELHDGVPVPKVIDFGIAKVTEKPLSERTSVITGQNQLMGTPAYMSPEQADMSGLDVDTRSDIYSLGVLLYELLTGKTPFDGKKLLQGGLDEMRRTLLEKEPQRPSTMVTTLQGTELKSIASQRRADPPRLVSLLKGDLDWIVLKTLEKDRQRRYETVNALAMDLKRFLNDEPVIARPQSQFYRLQKLVKRNKVVFVSGVTVILALIIGFGAATWMFFKEREARQEAVVAEQQQAVLREAAEASKKRETELRAQAEAREKINQAAILVSQQRYDEANQLLDEIKTPPPRPSFDGISAFRWVADWLAVQGRWQDAANRFATLMAIDKLDDLNVITLDYQSCGIVLAESGDVRRYKRFCNEVVANFATNTNGTAAGRILKVSLLMPPDKALLNSLSALADVTEKSNGRRDTWASIPLALWAYRCGDYPQAIKYCQISLSERYRLTVQATTDRIIQAMADHQLGRQEQAESELAESSAQILAKFKSEPGRGDAHQGFWWDWVFARILMCEATSLIKPDPAYTSVGQKSTSPQ